jgi:hypothetical protein
MISCVLGVAVRGGLAGLAGRIWIVRWLAAPGPSSPVLSIYAARVAGYESYVQHYTDMALSLAAFTERIRMEVS